MMTCYMIRSATFPMTKNQQIQWTTSTIYVHIIDYFYSKLGGDWLLAFDTPLAAD